MPKIKKSTPSDNQLNDEQLKELEEMEDRELSGYGITEPREHLEGGPAVWDEPEQYEDPEED